MKFWFFLVSILFFFSCKTDSQSPKVESPKEEITEVVPPAPPVTGSQKPIDGDWAEFWSRFQNATKSKSRSLHMSMIYFPLKWAEDVIPEDDYSKYHRRIFELPINQKILSTKASDVSSEKLYGEAYEKSQAKALGLKPGVKVYKLKHSNFQIVDGGLKEVATEYFYFPKFDDRGYLLAWIEEKVH